MRTLRFLVTVLALCGVAAAADSTSAAPASLSGPSPAKDSAALVPADTVMMVKEAAAAAPSAPAVEKKASPLAITWYGMAMLRFREDIITNFKTTDTVEASAALSQRIAYKIGARVKPNDQMLLQFELGNDWHATEEVDPKNYLGKRGLSPWFSLAYAQWDPGYLTLAAGIIPVKGTALMDLLAVSIYYDKRYKAAAHFAWGDITNMSQTGMRIGVPVLKGGFKLGVEAMTAVIQQRNADLGVDTMKVNGPAWEYLIQAPMEFDPINLKIGPGNLDFDVKVSTEYNQKDTTVNDLYPFADLKYGWAVNKNFIIMPRCRLFFTLPKTKYDYKLTTRPEIIFTGGF
jgi:hypothetical protein